MVSMADTMRLWRTATPNRRISPHEDEDLGPVKSNWVEVYTSDILVVRFKSNT